MEWFGAGGTERLLLRHQEWLTMCLVRRTRASIHLCDPAVVLLLAVLTRTPLEAKSMLATRFPKNFNFGRMRLIPGVCYDGGGS